MKRSQSSYPSNSRKRVYAPKQALISKSNAAKLNKLARNIEKKNVYVTSADTAGVFPQAAVSGLAFRVDEGIDDGQRIGRSINVERASWNIVVTGTTTGAPPTQINSLMGVARFMVVWDKQPNGVLATVGDILETAAVAGISELNLDRNKRFVILSDQTKPLCWTLGHSQNIAIFKGSVKINRQAHYTGTTGVIGSISSGALLTVGTFLANGTLAGDPCANYSFLTEYTDL